MADNPRLTSRLPREPVRCGQRFVFDGQFRLRRAGAGDFHVFADEFAEQTTLVVDAAHGTAAREWLGASPVQVWEIDPPEGGGRVEAILMRLTEAGLTGLYLEGGPGVWSAFLNAGRIDYLFAYRASVLLGDASAPGPFAGQAPASPALAHRLAEPRVATFRGGDQLVRGFVRSPE